MSRKLCALREKDQNFVDTLITAGLVDPRVIAARLAAWQAFPSDIGERLNEPQTHPRRGDPTGQNAKRALRRARATAEELRECGVRDAAVGPRRGWRKDIVPQAMVNADTSSRAETKGRERPLVHIRTRICASDPVPLKPATLLPSSPTICRSGILKQLMPSHARQRYLTANPASTGSVMPVM